MKECSCAQVKASFAYYWYLVVKVTNQCPKPAVGQVVVSIFSNYYIE